MPHPGLDALFNPRSVAIIGASDDPTRIGGRPLRYLKESGFEGAIRPVNPRRDRVQGIEAYPDVGEAPGEIDVAIVAVPAGITLETLEACAGRGVKAAIVFTSGFAETDADGAARQRRMGEIARASGMRILGPNCLGVYNAAIGYFATFTTTLDLHRPKPGPVAIVSQSGAYGSHIGLLAHRRRIGVGFWATTGNECDVTASECIAWMAGRPEIDVVAAYAEGVRDGDALLRSLDAARAGGKCVFFTKTGRSEVGAEAARSHTAALAGADAVFDAVLAQHGVVRAGDTEEMLDAAYAASFGALPSNRRIGIVTISGGAGVLMADEAAARGLEVAPMPEAAQRRLKEKISFCTPRNPVDVTAQVFNAPHLVGEFLDAMLDDGDYGAVVVFFSYVASVRFMAKPVLEALARARERHPRRPILMSMIGSGDAIASYEALNVPVFEDPVRAVRAVSALARAAEGLAQPSGADADRDGNADAVAYPSGDRHSGARLGTVPAERPRAVTSVHPSGDRCPSPATARTMPVVASVHPPGHRYPGGRLDEREALQPPSPPAVTRNRLTYEGDRGALAKIAVTNALLTMSTLGIYRFWGKTRVRRHLWSRTSFLDDSLEYTGTGKELCLGFLVAAAVVGLLVATGFGIEWAFAEKLPALLVLDSIQIVVFLFLIGVAAYRARRYRLVRTQWRGIRFSQDGSSLRYALLAIGWGSVAILSLGIAYPVYRTRLQHYRTTHTFFGDRRFRFEGRAAALMRPWLLAWLLFLPTLGLTYLWYRVREFRYFAGKSRCGALSFESGLRTGPVLLTVLVYVGLSLITLMLAFGFVFGILLLPAASEIAAGGLPIAYMTPGVIAAVLAVAAATFVVSGLVQLLFFTHPLCLAVCNSFSIIGDEDYRTVTQGRQAMPGRGEGLADVLDVGAI